MQFCRQTGATAELRVGKLTHYAVDRLRNWKPSKLRGYGQVGVSVKLCDTAYSTLHLRLLVWEGWCEWMPALTPGL